MKKIDITNWKVFALTDLFQVVLSKGDIQAKKMNNGSIPLVSSGKFNNGICKYISEGDGKAEMFCSNVITTDMFGKSYYQAIPFFAVSHGRVNILLPKFDLTADLAMFIVSVLDASFLKKYSFTGMCNQKELIKETIKLPVTFSGSPDWQYMENYMRQIEKRQRTNLQIINNLLPPPIANKELNKLSTKNWKSFRIGDLFEIKNGKGITKQEIFENPGNIPAIQSGEENFGRIGYIDIKYCLQKKYTISLGECLTVARSGSSGFVGYQEKQCVVGDSAKILEPKFISNTLRLLFIRTMLMVNKARYAYTDKVTKDNYAKDTIKLPVLSDGTPDWTYMEQYITMLMDKQARNLKQLA